MTELEEYKEDLNNEIKLYAQADKVDAASVLLDKYTEILIGAEEFDDFTPLYYQGVGPRKKIYQIDGYSFEEGDNSLVLVAVDYAQSGEDNLSKTDIERIYSKMKAFC